MEKYEKFSMQLSEGDPDVEFIKTIEGSNYGGRIYRWHSQRLYVVVHGQKFKMFSDYCTFDFFKSRNYAESALRQDINFVDNYGGAVV